MAVSQYALDRDLLTDPEVVAMTLEGYHVRRRKNRDEYSDFLVIKDGTHGWYFGSLQEIKRSWKEDWRGCSWWDVWVDP